jgi:aryl-alcohol dehydrogenase-like predicted oxidoreductase
LFRAAAASGVAVFIRSIYLQGLLVMPEEAIPATLRAVVPVRRRLGKIAGEAGLTPAELAFRYMLSQEGVTSVLTGVETIAQIRENLALCASGPLPGNLLEAINAAVPDLGDHILTPSLWPTLASPK